LAIYHFTIDDIFDFKLFMDNLNILFYRESAYTISSRFTSFHLFFISIIFLPIFYLGVLKNNKILEIKKGERKRNFIFIIIYGILILSPFNKYDEFAVLSKDMLSYFYNPLKVGDYGKKMLEKEYPFINKVMTKGKNRNFPHIFILPIESFNANFVESKTREGKEYTPFFNSLIKKGLYVDNFYGSSIQTAKGLFSILCSMIPKSNGKVFQNNIDTNFRCLPEVLKERGFTNLFFQSYRDINFDNTGNFLKKNHFDGIEALDEKSLSLKEQKENIWGWGPQDNILYKHVFNKLDKIKGNKTFFVTLQGISSHMPFDKVPQNQKRLYTGHETKKQNYANSIHIVDHYLKTFFKELKKRDYLKNSIVVITGDHSFPVGEHNIFYNESGFYNEFFKIPLLILWNDHLLPKRIKKSVFSQVDIAPTLLDLLKVQSSNSFQGQSIIKGGDAFQYLIQPYSGKYLSVIKFPFKYVFHEKTGKEYLFNLKNDSLEKLNLLSLPRLKKSSLKIFKKLKRKRDYFYVNDYLIEKNRVWMDEKTFKGQQVN
jgi:phosphoglycerol transferase MdoB-like AlkP superfamily enzyme